MLSTAAKGRHFAMYFRDERVQEAFVHRGLSGDLSETDHDYLGVFTQNINGSKADYWQRRIVDSDVKLAADGSAEVTLTVTVQNPSPPWVHADDPDPSQDPRFGYYTRWAGNSVAVFLPRGAQVQGQATIRAIRDVPFKPIVRSVLDRPYFNRKVLLEPGSQAILKVTYTVPDAATVDGDSLVYGLDIDPQATVVAGGRQRDPAPAAGLRPERAAARLGDRRRPDAEVHRRRPRRVAQLRGQPLEAVTLRVRPGRAPLAGSHSSTRIQPTPSTGSRTGWTTRPCQPDAVRRHSISSPGTRPCWWSTQQCLSASGPRGAGGADGGSGGAAAALVAAMRSAMVP